MERATVPDIVFNNSTSVSSNSPRFLFMAHKTPSDAWVSGDAWVFGDAMVSGRFDLTTNCDIELPRIKIGTKSKLMKLKKFLDKF